MYSWEDRNTYAGSRQFVAPDELMADRILDRASARDEVEALLRSVGFEDPTPRQAGRKPRPTYA